MPADAAAPDNARQTGPALEAMHQLLLWLVPTVDRFPRSQKFLIEATCTHNGLRLLAAANLRLENGASCSTSPMTVSL